eukprot:PITA_09794
MIVAAVIEPAEEPEWVSPMVVQENKIQGEIIIYVDLRKLNDACLHDPFTDEVLDNVGAQEVYPFTYGISRYHQIRISLEDRHKNTFAIEWGSYQYKVMSFGLKNAPTIFSRVVVATFKEYMIHNFLEVYVGNCTVFGLLNKHTQELMVDPAGIAIIVNLPPSKAIRQLRTTLGHIGYYRKFIKGYAMITAPMEKLLKKDVTFKWDEECQKSVDILKERW